MTAAARPLRRLAESRPGSATLMASPPMRNEFSALVVSTRARLSTLWRWTALLWLIEIVDFGLGGALDSFGVVPRSLSGLWGILFAPLLHGGFGHLLGNTLVGVPLGFLAMARRRMDFYVVGTISAITAGLGAWLFGGAGSVHIGASGVIFGFLGFLMARGFYDRRVGAVLLSLFVTFTFGGMVWGVLPLLTPGVSWQSHLFGFLGGVFAASSLASGAKNPR